MGNYSGYRNVTKYKVIAELTTPMHVGASFSDDNGVLIHPTDRVPFIQASSIVGCMRDYYERIIDKEGAEDLFGSHPSENGSRIVASDGRFENPDHIVMEFRPRVKIDSASGTVSKGEAKGTKRDAGHKFDIECVAAGNSFSFEIYVKENSVSDEEGMFSMFSALHSGAITLGGQNSNGFGCVTIKQLLKKSFDLTEQSDRLLWIREDKLGNDKYEDITQELKKTDGFTYRIIAKGKTESGILVKGYKKTGFGKAGADAVPMMDARGNYIVPGSSIKGTLRSQIERIISYKGFPEITVTNIFGETESGGKAGNVVVYDAIISPPLDAKSKINSRIHIDKVSGGVINSGLFSEQRTCGNLEIRIDIKDRNNPELSCGYMIYALRDLALNLYNLGGEYSIGSGMIEINAITVETLNKKAVLNMRSGEVSDPDNIIEKCIKATGEE